MDGERRIREKQQTGRRETYLDGLLELAIGGVLFIVALATGRPAFYWTYLAAILILGPGLQRLKARYTYPRIGYVKFPDEDPKSLGKGIASWVIGVFLLVAVVLTLSGHLTDNLAWQPGRARLPRGLRPLPRYRDRSRTSRVVRRGRGA